MTTRTTTTTVVQTETTETIKNEQVQPMHVVDKTGSCREDLYGMLCGCKWTIVAIVFIICVLLGFRPELGAWIVFFIVMKKR